MQSSAASGLNWDAVLYDAALAADLPLMQDALDHGADTNYHSHSLNFQTSFIQAIHSRSVDAVELMLRHGGDATWKNPRGDSPLHIVTAFPSPRILDLLLDWGADPNMPRRSGTLGVNGDYPLHCAAEKCSMSALHTLLRSGADPYAVNEQNNKIPMDKLPEYAERERTLMQYYLDLPRLDMSLPFTKADLFKTNGEGYCPLDNPVTWRHWDFITEQLEENGEYVSKDELFRPVLDGECYFKMAIEARSLPAVVKGLNKGGESISIEELQAKDVISAEPVSSRQIVSAIFTADNLQLQGRGALARNRAALSNEGEKNFPAFHTLIAKLGLQQHSSKVVEL